MATKAPIRLVVVTPERQVVSEQTASVVFAAHDGELGVLHNRAPLMCELGIGQLRYEAGGQTRRCFVDGGFAQVREDTVTILAHQAIPAEQVTPEMVGEAERKLEELRGTGPEAQEERSKAQQRASALRRILANE
ncbi:MAG TPA: ATP synthase F1 subunit epsilon [Phycisphaerae bacterium]|jgi:F-type H+-transporting ATPase subunit epsilon|nr:ATP synthase F1 subunit epsilon [Phycisphaerae bacterium]HPC21446.1 ATP synthase F1 subunit epsilon [Phycisphaerae bacterium]